MKKPVPPKLTVTMSSPCFPVENQSPKRTKEVVSTDESDEGDFEVFPTRSKLKQVPYSGTSSESDSDEGSSHPKINEAVTKSRILAESARRVTKRKSTKCARDKFPMEEGEWQYRVYKMLSEIKDIVSDSRTVIKSNDVNISKMNSVEDINDFEKELVNLW